MSIVAVCDEGPLFFVWSVRRERRHVSPVQEFRRVEIALSKSLLFSVKKIVRSSEANRSDYLNILL